MNYGLAGRTIAVTGAASGIGFAVVSLLAAGGARVAMLDYRQAELDHARAALPAGSRCESFAIDVRDESALIAAVDTIETRLGPVEGLVNSAGISGASPAESLSAGEFADVMSVNVNGLFLCCREFGRRMIGRKRGAIVNVGSIDGLGGQAGRTHYVASKFAVNGITKNLALEWGRHGVRVNCVAPTMVDTPLLRRNVPPEFVEQVVVERTPMGRMASADDIAAVIAVLLSDATRFVSGVILPIDGGLCTGHMTAKGGADLSSNRLLEQGVYSL